MPMKKFIIVMAMVFICLLSISKAYISDDMKGIWVATVYNLDYPSSPTTDVNTLKNEIKTMLNNIYEMGYNAISPSSESTFIPDFVLNSLKKRFKRILLCFDRDPSGCKNSIKLYNKTKIKPFFVHKKFKAKDISDAVKENSFVQVKNWLDYELQQPRNK